MRPNRRAMVVVIGVVVLVVVLAGIRATRVREAASAPTIQAAATPVVLASARMGRVASTIDEQGVLVAETEAAIAPQVMARCLAVYKHEGDRVRMGEVIARLDGQELQDARAVQEAEVAGARESAAAQAAEAARAGEDVAARSADVSAAEAGLAAQLSDIDAAQQTIAAQRADVDGAQQAVAAQQAEVQRVQENLAAAQVAAATQRSRTARDKILYDNKAISLEQWEASQTAAVQADAGVAALRSQIVSLGRTVDAAKQRVTSLERGVDAARHRVASLQHGVDSARQRVVSLKAMVADARQHQAAQRRTAAAAGANVAALASSAAMAGTRLGYTTIRAPYDAVVTARLAEPGSLLAPGQPIYRVLRPGSVKVTASVPQEALAQLHVGTVARLTAQGQSIGAKVSRVYPALNGGRLGTVEIDLSRSPFGLHSGSTLEVDLDTHSGSGVTVPAGALLESERGRFVYLVEGGQVRIQAVELEARGADEVVVSGVQPGAQVVVAQPSELMTLRDGQRVVPVGSGGDGNAIR